MSQPRFEGTGTPAQRLALIIALQRETEHRPRLASHVCWPAVCPMPTPTSPNEAIGQLSAWPFFWSKKNGDPVRCKNIHWLTKCNWPMLWVQNEFKTQQLTVSSDPTPGFSFERSQRRKPGPLRDHRSNQTNPSRLLIELVNYRYSCTKKYSSCSNPVCFSNFLPLLLKMRQPPCLGPSVLTALQLLKVTEPRSSRKNCGGSGSKGNLVLDFWILCPKWFIKFITSINQRNYDI